MAVLVDKLTMPSIGSNKEKEEELTELIKRLLGGVDSPSRIQWQRTLGVSAPAISQWFTGKNLPRPETLLKILIVYTRKDPASTDYDLLNAIEQMGLRPAETVSNLLALQGYPCLSAYIASAVAARIHKQLGEVLQALPPISQVELLGHLQSLLTPRPAGQESTAWLQRRFNVREAEIKLVSDSFVESVMCSVRHSQMLSTLHRKHQGHADEFLESVMFLTAWQDDDITVASSSGDLDKKRLEWPNDLRVNQQSHGEADALVTPEKVIERIRPKRATVRYRRVGENPDHFLRRVV